MDEMIKREKQRVKEANTAAKETPEADEDRFSDVVEERCSEADEDRFSEADEDLEVGEELETGVDSRYLIRLLDAVDEADEGLLATKQSEPTKLAPVALGPETDKADDSLPEVCSRTRVVYQLPDLLTAALDGLFDEFE